MSRLADYFVIVGYDHEKKDRNGPNNGIVLQRFPEKDWEDTAFTEGIEWFCQPQGWALSTERQEPRFYVSVLTNMDATRHFCACLCFNETISITPSKPVDEEEDTVEGDSSNPRNLSRSLPNITHHSIMYAPKCLVLVSRLDYIETFRNCLGIIYTVYVESLSVPLENLVGNILGCIQVPAPGGPQVRFSIGAGDRQALQPPLSASLPVTHTAVSLLFHQLGISNVIVLFCAALTEHKILFHSASYSRLAEACRAITALLYPFQYSHVYIPLLPSGLLEVLSTPTPFLMGVHSSQKHKIPDLVDVLVADLDGGAISVPDGAGLVPLLPEPILTITRDALTSVLQPELSSADFAFPPPILQPQRSAAMLDKELRAVLMRTFAQLLHGYRTCLTIIRIHPKPVITFHKAAFLGERGLSECEFTRRVLDCMFFTGFVAERGPPWRTCDLWDELYSALPEQMRLEQRDPRLILLHIQELAQQLYLNENPNPQPYVQKLLKPPEGASARIHQPPLPMIDSAQVQAILDEGLAKNNIKAIHASGSELNWLSSPRPAQPRIVPSGGHLGSNATSNAVVVAGGGGNSARRLEVLRNCIQCIFENKISEARKSFPAVVRALKARVARLALCAELGQRVLGNKAMLEHQQFDLVVRLMNCALQDDSPLDEHGVAAALLPLATAFCRKLCTGVIQFAYTCIQEHSVWQNQQFWEAAFYQDVQKEIKALYFPRGPAGSPSSGYEGLSVAHHQSPHSPREGKETVGPGGPSALEIAAEQMRLWSTLESSKQNELAASEESTLYSQAIHYANRMVYLLVPLDASSRGHHHHHSHHHWLGDHRQDAVSIDDRASMSLANSVAESDSGADAESGFDEQEPGELGAAVIRQVSRFVDKVCTEGGVSAEHVRSLHQMIPGVVHMHIETLDAVHRESKRLPPIQKPKILTPTLLPGEETLMDGLRVYLLPDGREEATGTLPGLPPLLPAEGAIFLTNYRIIFKGTPCDPFACEQIVVRSFPVTSLTKEKRVTVQYLAHLDQWLQEGLQLRSCTFQLLKLAFDEVVTAENVESFRKLIHKVRHPPHVLHHFAFTGQSLVSQTPLHKTKEKNATLKGFAKKTLMKTARKAGFKPKSSSKRQKYVLPTNITNNKYLTSPGRMSLPLSAHDLDDDISMADDLEAAVVAAQAPPTDAKTLERQSERSYVRDWHRLGLFTDAPHKPGDPFRLSAVNSAYLTCRSYPALIVLPGSVTDDSVRKACRCFRHQRIPSVTWRHPRTRALLLRGAGFHGKGVIGMLKSHPSSTSGAATSSETTSSVEQERYLAAVVAATPAAVLRQGSAWGMSDSSLSIDSLLLAAASGAGPNHTGATATLTPELARRAGGGRNSGGKGTKSFTGRWGSLKERRHSSQGSLQAAQTVALSVPPNKPNQRHSADSDSGTGTDCVQTLRRAALYIVGEKAQMRGVKAEAVPKAEFLFVDYPDVRHTKAAFKKLMRACIPSSVSNEPEHSFYCLMEASEWLQQLQTVMKLAGTVLDLLDSQGSSVMLCLEDGWDVTAQISALAQLCLDPHYRTIDGFRVLVEKEWLAFGHRFSQRSNLAAASQAAGFAPTFLQFLDIVHQIQRQFPLAFEFNDYYLRFLAYHSVSCRFRTFLLDCELERVECGVAAQEDKRGSLASHHAAAASPRDVEDDDIYPGGPPGSSNAASQPLGQSVFDYIDKQHARSPLFYNFMYTADYAEGCGGVLRPLNDLACLEPWGYYLGEELSRGPSYDLELVQMDAAQREQDEATESLPPNATRRTTVTTGYDSIERLVPSAFSHLLDEIRRLETELGHLPQKWKLLWDRLELPSTDSLTRHASFSTQLVRSHGRLVHKRSTLEILMRGKMAAGSTGGGSGGGDQTPHIYSHPHRFDKYNYTTPTYCDLCTNVLWGPVKTGLRCMDCGYSCHEKCAEAVPSNCTKYKSVSDGGVGPGGINPVASGLHTIGRSGGSGGAAAAAAAAAAADAGSVASSVTTLQTSSQHYYDQFSSNVAENRTHEGYLYKRGALLKGWKQRWFVLDSIKHQLRYYDAMEDSHCKGFIDLAEVMSVAPATPAPGPPKKTDDKSFFDLRTNRRTYNFCAGDASSAQEWIEKIQACLQ